MEQGYNDDFFGERERGRKLQECKTTVRRMTVGSKAIFFMCRSREIKKYTNGNEGTEGCRWRAGNSTTAGASLTTTKEKSLTEMKRSLQLEGERWKFGASIWRGFSE